MNNYNFIIFNVIDIISCVINITLLTERFLKNNGKIEGNEIFMILFFMVYIFILIFKIVLLTIYVIKVYYKNLKKKKEYMNLVFIINICTFLFLMILYYFNYNINLYFSILYYMSILSFISLCIIIFLKEMENGF